MRNTASVILSSTRHAILDIVSSVQMNLDKKIMFSRAIFLHLEKDFDTVNHSILGRVN